MSTRADLTASSTSCVAGESMAYARSSRQSTRMSASRSSSATVSSPRKLGGVLLLLLLLASSLLGGKACEARSLRSRCQHNNALRRQTTRDLSTALMRATLCSS